VGLLAGRVLMARARISAHGACVVAAVIARALFLGCQQFLPRKLGNIRFLGEGWLRPVYCAILVSPVTLAIVTVPLAILTLSCGRKARYDKPRHCPLDWAAVEVGFRYRSHRVVDALPMVPAQLGARTLHHRHRGKTESRAEGGFEVLVFLFSP
jgi:uncharacterized membrane protein YozB (DUF420 family)